MRSIKKTTKIFLFILPILFIGTVFGYDNIITHPQITEAAIKIYQNQSNKILTGDQANWIIEGSIDEDTFPRYLNHYFDPTTGKGLDDYDETLKQNFTGISAKEWVKNQSSWVGLSGDYSEGAILKNYKEGNLKRAYQGIGHILHLAQDMSVPAHTRNDSHAGGDPYENWAKQNGQVDLIKASFIVINDLDQVFSELALFSHNNFFSKDTIPKDISNFKKIIEFNGGEKVGYLTQYIEGIEIKLAYSEQPDVISPIYSVEENYQVHADYWSILHPKAVGYSAGAIEYFINQFKKIDEEKSNQNISFWDKTKIFFTNLDDNSKYLTGDIVIGATNIIYDAYVNAKETVDYAKDIFSAPQFPSPLASVANIGQIAGNQAISDQRSAISLPDQGDQQLPIDDQQSAVGNEQLTISSEQPVVISNEQLAISLPAQTGNQQPVQIQQEIIHAPYYRAPEVIHAPYQTGAEQTQNSIQDSNIITSQFQGQFNGSFTSAVENQSQNILPSDQNNAEADSQQDSLTGSEQENISSQESIEQPSGEETQNQNTETQSEETPINSEPEQEPPEQDIIPPETPEIIAPKPTFYLTDYDVRKMNFTLNWGDENGVIKEWELEYKLAPNFEWEVLCGTDTEQCGIDAENQSLFIYNFTANYDDLTYYFRLRGKDASGNFGDWLTLEAEISTKPVVINEIAWMGTTSSAYDEWMELANKTNQEIDLSGWILKTIDGIIDVKLDGKIAANGFYLLERATESEVGTVDENSAIANIMADQIYKGALTNKQYPNEPGQNLKLLDKDNIEIDNVLTFYSGDNNSKRTSERVNIWSPSTYKNNWLAYSGSGNQEALDANGNPVFGTPKAKNSQADKYFALNSGVFEASPSISKDTIFLKNRSPYTANGSVGATNIEVLIEPGASLEFNNFGMLGIYDGGKLIAKGTENDKITIKTSTSNGVALYFSGAKGEFENMEISGGKVVANNSTIKITNSAIKNANGLLTLQNNSEFDISNSEFSGDNGYNFAGNPYYGEAILIKQSQGIIQNSKIKNNQAHGIYIDSFSGALDISGNNFSSNGRAPIATNGFINLGLDDLNLDGNIFGVNDALMIYNPTVKAGEEETISSQIPYFLYTQAKGNAQYKIGDPEIKAGGILRIEPGAVVKFNDKSFLNVHGKLEAMGTLEKPIVLKWPYDYGSYDDMVSNIAGTVSESDFIRLNDDSEAVLENVISRQKVVDRYRNTSYQSFYLVRE